MDKILIVDQENAGRAKIKCELRKLKINFFFSESTSSLKKKLAAARIPTSTRILLYRSFKNFFIKKAKKAKKKLDSYTYKQYTKYIVNRDY